MNIRQRIYNTAGTYCRIEILQSSTSLFSAGDGHSQWYVYKLQRFEVHPPDASGREGELKRTGADPQNWVLESNNANNGTWTDIKISATKYCLAPTILVVLT